jgi:hypothetical protein
MLITDGAAHYILNINIALFPELFRVIACIFSEMMIYKCSSKYVMYKGVSQ